MEIKEQIKKLVADYNCKAFIFDLDGTMVDNNPYHIKAFHVFLQKYGKKITESEYKANINGRTNKDAFNYIFETTLSTESQKQYAEEKERIYRELYATDIIPVNGLVALLEAAHEMKIPMAIATSGIPPNIEFFFEHIPVKQFFSAVVHSGDITNGKPHPEIYLKAAEKLGVAAKHCIAFEDAAPGVQSAHDAGMKVIAILTTDTKENLSLADKFITNFTGFY